MFNENGTEVFDSFYMCFSGLRDTWKDHCRPIFGIDGCFLKSDAKGQLLAAVGRDANNQIYPFAWAVVHVENHESWSWFIRHLKNDLGLNNGEGFTVISDRQKVRFLVSLHLFFFFGLKLQIRFVHY